MRKTEEVLQATDQLLRSLSGVVNAGDLVVVLGPKRSGKTLLLQALSGRLSSEDFSSDGKIYVNNQQADSDLLRFTSGYVPADYPFCGALTVKEHLLFQAYLRIEERYSLDEKAALVEDMIKEIGLSNCADFKIGIPGRLKSQVSLCEKRLLAFATESLTNPAVLCCDEPLAGLDAFEAEKVITFLKRMTQRGKIVIYAQTRPTSEAFGLSDKVAILHAGRSAFFGTTDEALDFFALSGFTCPFNCNPADHYVGSLVGSATLTDIERNEQTKFICDKYLVSNTLDKVRRKLENTSRMSRICTTAKTIKPKSAWRTSWTFQLSMLLWRGALCAWRDPFCITASFVFHVFTGLTIGIFFLQQDPHTQIGRDAINGVLLLIVCLLGVFPLLGALAISLPEYRQFQQESAEAICSVSAFSVSHCLLRLPQHICFSALLVTLSYWLVGLLPSAPAFLTACCVAALLSMVAESFFWLVTISTKGRGLTLTLSFLIGFPLFLLNGFLPRLKFVPGWLNWISYLSWFRYAMDALTCNQWRYMAHFWQDYPGSNFSHIGVGSDVRLTRLIPPRLTA
ncbi:Protein white [Hypsibius exemplaris]|uniref:Protein white n=1 Tax=Hypsibius exemplaris TaxID=2072580 RepID=A0A1W0WXK4_HYPEX|nr:Protein white [Hypsibius exemplaris]